MPTAGEEFIPGPDAAALASMRNFSNKLTAGPGTYGVTADDALMIKTAVDAFEEALEATQDPAARTEVTVAAKDYTRASAEQVCRLFGGQIKINAGVSDEAKIAAGIKPVNNTRTPVPPPSTSPMLSFIGTTPDGSHTLRYSDSATPDSRARPHGAANLQLFRVIADAPVESTDNAVFYAVFSRNPLSVGFKAADTGKWVTYFARWCTIKSEVGPWSAPLSMPIATIAGSAAA